MATTIIKSFNSDNQAEVTNDNALKVTVSGSVVTDPDVNIHDSTGNALNSTAGSLNVNVTNTVPVTGPLTDAQLRASAVPISGTVTSNIGTTGGLALDTTVSGLLTDTELRASPVPVSGTVTANAGTGTFLVDGSAHTQPISGTVTANQGTSPWVVSGSISTSPDVNIHDSAGNALSSTAGSLDVDVTNTVTVSGTVTANIGTTGGLALDATVAGLLTDTELRASPVPISGTVTADAGSGTFLVDGSAHTQPISAAALPLPAGAATDTNQATEITALGTINTTLGSPMQNSGGSVTANQGTSPWVVSGTVTTSPNVNVHDGSGTAITSTGSSLNVDVTNTVTVSGTVAVTQATGTNLHAVVDSGHIITDSGSVTNATLSAETTKVIGTINIASGQTVGLAAGSQVIGHVITDSGSTTAVTGNVAATIADGADVTLGAKADAKSTATDTTPISVVSILKQISASVQAPPSQAVTNTGTFAVQATLAAETTKVIGTVNQGTSPWVNNTSQINGVTPLMGNGTTGTGSQRVTIASDNTAFAVNATLSAETTKVIGVVRNADGAGNLLTSTSFNSKQSLDVIPNNGFSTASNTRTAVDNSTSVQLLAANLNRKYAYIMNNTGKAYYLKLGAAAVVGQGILLSNNGMYEINADNLWTGTVNAISTSSTSTSLDVFEGTP